MSEPGRRGQKPAHQPGWLEPFLFLSTPALVPGGLLNFSLDTAGTSWRLRTKANLKPRHPVWHPTCTVWRRIFAATPVAHTMYFALSNLSRTLRHCSRPTPSLETLSDLLRLHPLSPGQPEFPASAPLPEQCSHPVAPPHVRSEHSKPSAAVPPLARPGPAPGGCPPDPTSGSSGSRPSRDLLPLTTAKAALHRRDASGTELCSRCGAGKRLRRSTLPVFS